MTVQELAELVKAESGLCVRREQLPALGTAASTGEGGELLERLVDEVAIKETFFLRDPAQLRGIDWRALATSAHAEGRTGVRVWSAACSTGEEAYTLCMLALETLGPAAPVDILATDISPSALVRARRGHYQARSLRKLAPESIERSFNRESEGFAVRNELRRLVRFKRHNLVRDSGPPAGESPFDLIVCRNVLIYFDTADVGRAVTLLESALHPGGVLILGAADALCVRSWTLASGSRPRDGAARRNRPTRSRREPHGDRRGRAGVKPRGDRVAAPMRLSQDQPAAPLAQALSAADQGSLDTAVEAAQSVLAAEPLNATAHYIIGIALIAAGDAGAATGALRRALYADGSLALAAFQLGRAYDALGETGNARRVYEQALRTLDPDDHRYDQLLGSTDIADVAAACAARLATLGRDMTNSPL